MLNGVRCCVRRLSMLRRIAAVCVVLVLKMWSLLKVYCQDC